MMDRQKGKFVFECDACPEVLETDTRDFASAAAARKTAGWIALRTSTQNNDWNHYCGKCARVALHASAR